MSLDLTLIFLNNNDAQVLSHQHGCQVLLMNYETHGYCKPTQPFAYNCYRISIMLF